MKLISARGRGKFSSDKLTLSAAFNCFKQRTIDAAGGNFTDQAKRIEYD